MYRGILLNIEECIYYRVYEIKILFESYQKFYIFYVYVEFCYECVNLELVFERLFKEFEFVGKQYMYMYFFLGLLFLKLLVKKVCILKVYVLLFKLKVICMNNDFVLLSNED